ncbi:hypothetical protein PFLUV_G00002250 [Perca fluviatilis]|uniref:VWFA domain-containing protein n=1 Tax=Perca fluviatilis TaxID=8168 RepID=A0A6A5FPJ2_PERFL|nr:hypothetical protein PFLUV_G00002250 [Perca fluviatilis]
MAGLCWLAVVLAFFMSDSLTAMEQDRLASIIQGIKNEYDLGDTFSLAVNIPQDQDINDLQQVFQDDPADKVKQTVSEGQVYQGTRVVAAAQPEALSRVLGNLQPLFKRSKGHFLLIYSEESPCGPTCTTNENKDRITGKINEIIQNWGSYAFVFSKVHDVPGADTPQLAESFKQLGVSKLGLDKVFRCYKPDDSFQCTSCLSDGDVTPACVANDVQSNQEQGVGGEEGTVPSTGTDTGKEKGEGMREDSNTGEEMAEGTGEEIATGEGGGTTGGKEKGKGGQVSKGRGSAAPSLQTLRRKPSSEHLSDIFLNQRDEKILLATDAKMARLCWMVLVLAFFLYDSVAAREQINLDLRDTIPQDQDPNALQQVSKDDPEGQVSQGQGLGGEEGAVQSTGTDTGEEMGEAIGTEMTIGKGGKGGKGL